MDYYEEYFINEYNSLDRKFGYNLKHGGKLGGCYSEESRKNMGEATKLKWSNPNIASKMKEGLNKGRETIKMNADVNALIHICPVCGKQFKTANWNSHTYCSYECSCKSPDQLQKSISNLELANKANKEKYEKRRKSLLPLVEEWVKINKNILENIVWNKLTFITDLCEYVQVKDHRTLAKLFNLKNKRDLVKKLIEISENIC